MTVTFSDDRGHDLGSVTITPTSINVQNDLWWLLNKIFPNGLFPYLDPSNTFEQFRRLPHQVPVRGLGTIRVYKS